MKHDIPPSIQQMIDDRTKDCDDIILALDSLIETSVANEVEAERTCGSANESLICDLSNLITRAKLLSLVFSVRHKHNASTAMEDENNSVKLQRFAQILADMRNYYRE